MNKRRIWMSVGLGTAFLLSVGVLVNMIGGVSVRSNDVTISRIAMHVVDPLTPGARTVVRWNMPSSIASQQVFVALRSKQGITVLTESPFFAGTASIQIPCTEPAGTASLELISSQNKSVIAWDTITISPAGPDCVR
ncbi:MAG: hypothetical protein A3E36_03765 [Candidatus Andersenbacteria bacterium RIFCSPHIGHO2_12_FULL_45_11b]|uniref:Uncharacterized protein n=1 Tax=Candidatus Andersenbacteria bacterium RIFCSPHIGHO2_12_FULL_45_11b TaxID=1797282 RepID=A0A1G1XB17_9BACT|nr:MAG: hypothetical protein A3E36_03765 [Candidatus Andersenbacteria bacterium RIFCSPHIGHO2_12_FULL_45_11b]